MTICYINFTLLNPRDQITIRGLKENGAVVIEVSDRTPGWRKYLNIARKFRACRSKCDVVMVGYSGAVLVPLVRVLTGKPLFYNTLSCLFDGMIVSRRRGTLASVRYYLIDFVAFHCAHLSFVESGAQRERVAKLFLVHRRKLAVGYVGADDIEFHEDNSVDKLPVFTAVFRGALLPEAGADVVVRAAKELERENIRVRLIGKGLLLRDIESLIAELKPSNLEFISKRLPVEDLRRAMLECHLSLGQMADHPRLWVTIPHKAFESMSMGLPYLTGANRGVLEILQDGETCFTSPPGDYRALARSLVELRDRAQERERVARNAHTLYLREFTPRALAKSMLARMSESL